MAYNRKDFFFNKAKAENYEARSVYKLEEMDKRFKLLRAGDKILDLGAAPGSWSQYASKVVGPKGRVIGIDLQPIKITLPNVFFMMGDILTIAPEEIFQASEVSPPFDLVMSDMAPRTTGIRITDQARSAELCEMALSVAERFLRKGGHFVVKFFHSEAFEDYRDKIKERFNKIEVLRPKSTRKESKEIFLVGKDYKGPRAK